MSPDETLVCIAIENMYRRGQFSIQVIERACALLGIVPDENFARLEMLDGVRFKDMDSKVFQALPRLICSVVNLQARQLVISFEDKHRIIDVFAN